MINRRFTALAALPLALLAKCDLPDTGSIGTPPVPAVVKMGEYQQNVDVEPPARLDVYFDQARTVEDMTERCAHMGGTLTIDTGTSLWAGWYFCMGADY